MLERSSLLHPRPVRILDQSGWVTPEQAEAAAPFCGHLLSTAVQVTAGDCFVRPLSPATPLGDRPTLANGTGPDASPASAPAFAIPSPQASERIIDQFQVTKRKATVVVVLADAQARDLAAGDNRLYGMVVLSDGKDTAGEVTVNRMLQTCLQTGAEVEGPRQFAMCLADRGRSGSAGPAGTRDERGGVFGRSGVVRHGLSDIFAEQ